MGINMVVAQPNFMKCALSRGGRTLLLRATLLGGQLVCWVGNTSAPRFTPSQCQTGSDRGANPEQLVYAPHYSLAILTFSDSPKSDRMYSSSATRAWEFLASTVATKSTPMRRSLPVLSLGRSLWPRRFQTSWGISPVRRMVVCSASASGRSLASAVADEAGAEAALGVGPAANMPSADLPTSKPRRSCRKASLWRWNALLLGLCSAGQSLLCCLSASRSGSWPTLRLSPLLLLPILFG